MPKLIIEVDLPEDATLMDTIVRAAEVAHAFCTELGGDMSLGKLAAQLDDDHPNFIKEKNVVLLVEGGGDGVPSDQIAIAVRMAVSKSEFDTDNWHHKYLSHQRGTVRRADYTVDSEGDMHRME